MCQPQLLQALHALVNCAFLHRADRCYVCLSVCRIHSILLGDHARGATDTLKDFDPRRKVADAF